MASGLSLGSLLIGAVLSTSWTYQRNGVEATSYQIYSCPVNWSSRKCVSIRRVGWWFPYGFKHTYVKINGKCYDWGDWDYCRHLPCKDHELSCCTRDATLRYSGSSRCASRVGEFEKAWESTGYSYSVWTWNCQKYVNAMKDFLNHCYSDPKRAVPSIEEDEQSALPGSDLNADDYRENDVQPLKDLDAEDAMRRLYFDEDDNY